MTDEKGRAMLLAERDGAPDCFVSPDTPVLSREELIIQIRSLREWQTLRVVPEVETDGES